MRCRHCWVSAEENIHFRQNDNKLDRNMITNVIEEALTLGLESIKISGGEPFIKPDMVFHIIELAQKNNIKVWIETNGTLLTEDIIRKLPNELVSLSISLDGSNEMIHDSMRGVFGAFNRTEKALNILNSYNLNIGITYAFEKIINEDIRNIIKIADKFNVTDVKLNPIMNIGRASNSLQDSSFFIDAKSMIDIYNSYCSKPFGNVNVSMMMPLAMTALPLSLVKSNKKYGACPTLNLLSILPNGDVGLCGEAKDIKELVFGNIFKNTLKEIWRESEHLNNYRYELLNNLEGVCGTCMLKNICLGSCRVSAYISGGKINSSNPICQELFNLNEFHLSKSSV